MTHNSACRPLPFLDEMLRMQVWWKLLICCGSADDWIPRLVFFQDGHRRVPLLRHSFEEFLNIWGMILSKSFWAFFFQLTLNAQNRAAESNQLEDSRDEDLSPYMAWGILTTKGKWHRPTQSAACSYLTLKTWLSTGRDQWVAQTQQ